MSESTPVDRSVVWTTAVRSVYLAGKVSPRDDWRESLVPSEYPGGASRRGGIVTHESDENDYPETASRNDVSPWPVRERALFGRYDFTGPYVEDLGHGEQAFGSVWGSDFEVSRQRAIIAARSLDAIARSDAMFVWLDDVSAYGTLTEMGFARAAGKTIWLAGPEEFSDLWFPGLMAHRRFFREGLTPQTALMTCLTVVREMPLISRDGTD